MAPYVPLWRRIRQEIQDKINAGILQPGDKLPTTRELAEQYDTSGVTVRKAIDILIEAGVLEGRQGIGVFVASTPSKIRKTRRTPDMPYLQPLWRQIRDDLRRKIQAGLLNPGEKIPTTRALMEQYGTTWVTVRRAVDSMIQSGELIGRQGLGVFVAEHHDS